VKLFKENIGPNAKIKAAGGISTIDDLKAFLDLGCDRIGTSRAVGLLKGEATEGY
ncbi:MAG: 2-deoxyribose-5-phosphate aldolase, partial [Lachnospiraceae bacterium]|nr:2-deoxyribose-5-phosphate aldolase [Lachnospiraceae bacterium]